jgi:LacI family transcriptional regulator
MWYVRHDSAIRVRPTHVRAAVSWTYPRRCGGAYHEKQWCSSLSEGLAGRRQPIAVTIYDVAKAAGVSVKTVSRVINNERWVQAETRERVLQTIRALDFHPSTLARSLVANRTRTIGLVVPTVSNPFFAHGIDGCVAVADERGYALSLASSGIDPVDPAHETRRVQALLMQRVAGIVVWASSLSASALAHMMDRARHCCPLVFIDHPVDPAMSAEMHLQSVLVQQEHVGALAAEHLLNEGRRRVAHISGRGGWPTKQRLLGYKKALASHDVKLQPHWIRRADRATIREGVIAATSLLARRPYPDAVFAYNDLLAVGVLLACRQAGCRVPDDVAIVGVDDTQLAAVSVPPLSTIRLHQYQTGRHATELLIRLVEAEGSTAAPLGDAVDLPMPDLIVRHSSRASSLYAPSFEDIDGRW